MVAGFASYGSVHVLAGMIMVQKIQRSYPILPASRKFLVRGMDSSGFALRLLKPSSKAATRSSNKY